MIFWFERFFGFKRFSVQTLFNCFDRSLSNDATSAHCRAKNASCQWQLCSCVRAFQWVCFLQTSTGLSGCQTSPPCISWHDRRRQPQWRPQSLVTLLCGQPCQFHSPPVKSCHQLEGAQRLNCNAIQGPQPPWAHSVFSSPVSNVRHSPDTRCNSWMICLC